MIHCNVLCTHTLTLPTTHQSRVSDSYETVHALSSEYHRILPFVCGCDTRARQMRFRCWIPVNPLVIRRRCRGCVCSAISKYDAFPDIYSANYPTLHCDSLETCTIIWLILISYAIDVHPCINASYHFKCTCLLYVATKYITWWNP